MKKKTRGLPHMPFFTKVFLAVFAASLIPIIILSGIYIHLYQKNIQEELWKSTLDILKQTQLSVDNIMYSTQRIAASINTNRTVQAFWHDNIPDDDEGRNLLSAVYNVCISQKADIPYIDEIIIYSFQNDIAISSNLHADEGSTMYFATFHASKDFVPGYQEALLKEHRWYNWMDSTQEDLWGRESGNMEYMELVLETFNQPKGLIIIKLLNSKLYQSIYELGVRNDAQLFIANAGGRIILHNDDPGNVDQWESLLHDYEGFGLSSGYDTVRFNGQPHLLAHSTSMMNEWKYFFLLDTKDSMRRVRIILPISILASALLGMLAAAFSLALTRFIRRPITSISEALNGGLPLPPEETPPRDEISAINHKIQRITTALRREQDLTARYLEHQENLQKQLDDNLSTLRNYFCFRLIYEDTSNNHQDIINQSRFLGIDPDGNYLVLLFEVDNTVKNDFWVSDETQREHILEGLQQIIAELLGKECTVLHVFRESVNPEKRVVAILEVDGQRPQEFNKRSMDNICAFIRNFIANDLHIGICIAVGSRSHGIIHLQESYRDAVTAMKYRFVFGASQTLFISDVRKFNAVAPDNYYHKKHFKNCLLSGNIGKIASLLEGLGEQMKTSADNGIDFTFYYKELINVINEYMIELSLPLEAEKKQLMEVFLGFDKMFFEAGEANRFLLDFIQRIFNRVAATTHAKKPAVQEALDLIPLHYGEDIGLGFFSSRLGISEAYLSKLFKDELGVNFKEYLTRFRMEKAKEFLGNDKLTILEISKKVGYNNYNQFSKMFKRQEGISPQEYRQSMEERKR